MILDRMTLLRSRSGVRTPGDDVVSDLGFDFEHDLIRNVRNFFGTCRKTLQVSRPAEARFPGMASPLHAPAAGKLT
jgi:hypothetical protein